MRRTRYLTIALLIFSVTSAASASQCSDRYLEEFNSQGGKDAWLKNMRGVQSQAKQALRTGVWSDGKKLSNERLRQIRDAVQEIEEDIAEGSDCLLPEQSTSTSTPARRNQPASAASNCPAKVVVVDTGRDYYGMHDLNSYEIVSTNPISIRANSGTRFLNSLPGSPAGDQWGEGTLLTDINSVLTKQREVLDSDQRRISSCSQGCCDSAASLCSMKRDNQARMVEWLQCVAKGSPMSSGSAVAARTGAASTQSGPNVGNASEVIGQRPNRKNAFNPNSPQGASVQNQSGSSDGECKNGDPSCAIRGCNRSGGKAITYRNNSGCGVVSCRFADTKNDWSSVYNNIPGSGCVGSTK